jgi:DNA-binding SARP family transcriptional activator
VTRAALMVALYRRGCRAEALESYRVVRGLLREQLGIEPGHLLRRLHALMLDDDPELSAQNVLAGIIQASPAALGRRSCSRVHHRPVGGCRFQPQSVLVMKTLFGSGR